MADKEGPNIRFSIRHFGDGRVQEWGELGKGEEGLAQDIREDGKEAEEEGTSDPWKVQRDGNKWSMNCKKRVET